MHLYGYHAVLVIYVFIDRAGWDFGSLHGIVK